MGVELPLEHTRIPNQLLDLILPRLSAAQQAVMLYAIRRTYGFASPTVAGQRKLWDRISLSQFINGTQSGGYVLDLGTGLTRPAVIRALRELEQMGILRVSYECATEMQRNKVVGCGWNQSDEDHLQTPKVDERTNAYACPRCGRTLAKAYALRKLTPGWIKRFLTSTDPKGRQWAYDPEVARYYPVTADRDQQIRARQTQAEQVRQQAAALRDQLWYPQLIDTIIQQAISRLASGKMAETRVISGFLQPAVEMQSMFGKPELQAALKTVIDKKIAAGAGRDTAWRNYAKAVATRLTEEKHGGKAKAQTAMAAAGVEEALRHCAALNKDKEREQARQALQDLIAKHLDTVTAEFGGDRPLARRHLLEAFKRGLDDYAYVRDYSSTTDYLPDWDWETDERNAAA